MLRSTGSRRRTRRLPVGDPSDAGDARRPADHRAAPSTRCRQRWTRRGRWRRGRHRRRAGRRGRRAAATCVRRWCGCRRRPRWCCGRPSRRSSTSWRTTTSTRRSRCTTRVAGPVAGIFTRDQARGGAVPRQQRTPASPTSTSRTSGAEIGGAFGGEKETGGGTRVRLGRLAGLHAPLPPTRSTTPAASSSRRACISVRDSKPGGREHDGAAAEVGPCSSSGAQWQRCSVAL